MRLPLGYSCLRLARRASLASLAMLLLQSFPAFAAAEGTIYSFLGGNDGAIPEAGLIDIGGMFYGTTSAGGGSTNCSNGCGTVFSVNAITGTDTIVYPFQGTDGADPQASLIDVGSMIYGTTAQGGTDATCSNCGTVFSVDPTTSTERFLYSFQGGSDGANPQADLIIARNGKLYGTTYSGGMGTSCSNGCGTVFFLNPATGAETVVYPFQGGSDGANPQADLLQTGGLFYGTTSGGGANTNCTGGCGTVFTINNKGAETVLYRFNGGSDGAIPTSGLVKVGKLLYGTTEYGGTGQCSNNTLMGCGTVYSISSSGTESVLYSFAGTSDRNNDGAYPTAALLNLKGTLWGTTTSGGNGNCVITGGCGVVFSVTTMGAESVQWLFQAGQFDGATPYAPLIQAANVLYGTTSAGGGSGCGGNGCGTLFEITPRH